MVKFEWGLAVEYQRDLTLVWPYLITGFGQPQRCKPELEAFIRC